MRSACPKKNSPASDMVMTPRPLAKQIIDHFKPCGSIIDPSLGEGAFYDQFSPKDGVTERRLFELDIGEDFLAWKAPARKWDWVMTNPPWSKFVPFLLKAMEVSNNVVFLVTLNHFQTKARMRMIGEAGFRFKEILLVDTPPLPWPQSGFQVAAVHIQKGWNGDCKFSKL